MEVTFMEEGKTEHITGQNLTSCDQRTWADTDHTM